MRFYSLDLKSHENTHFQCRPFFCKLRPSWAKSSVGPYRFEISVPKFSCI